MEMPIPGAVCLFVDLEEKQQLCEVSDNYHSTAEKNANRETRFQVTRSINQSITPGTVIDWINSTDYHRQEVINIKVRQWKDKSSKSIARVRRHHIWIAFRSFVFSYR